MNRDKLFEKLFVKEVAEDVLWIIFTSMELSRLLGRAKAYRYEILDKEVLVIGEREEGERVLESFFVDTDYLVLYCAEKVIREKLAERLYINLLEALAKLRVVLRLSNLRIYKRAESFKGVKERELKECFWYSETLLYNIINAFGNLNVLEGIISFRIFLEEFVNMILLFLNLDKEGKFSERVDKLEKAGVINRRDASVLRHTYSKVSEILHASHSALGGRESYWDHKVIGRMGLDFDCSLAVEQKSFLSKKMIKCVEVLLRLLFTVNEAAMEKETE